MMNESVLKASLQIINEYFGDDNSSITFSHGLFCLKVYVTPDRYILFSDVSFKNLIERGVKFAQLGAE